MDKAKVMDNMKLFKERGMSHIESLEENDIADMIKLANEQFHSLTDAGGEVTLTDNEFDVVKEYLTRVAPDNAALGDVGAPVERKVKLPVNMPSMDKIKPDSNALAQWKGKYDGPYVLSCKLDGVSGLYYSLNGVRKLYTRGDGTYGQDISHLLKYIDIPNVSDVIVRGEFIIPKHVFEEKYSDKFANARNLVAGTVNRKSADKKAKDIDFVAYEVIDPEIKPSEQMQMLADKGFVVVRNEAREDVTNESLSVLLIDVRTNYEYEIDGIIVSDDKVHPRKAKNPDHSFAFKMVMSDQVTEAKVVDVIWSPSKSGYLKPRVRIEPVQLAGVTIEYATGFNGAFIEKNNIGVGAVVQLVRSGDVIPHIKDVTTPAEKPLMPELDYVWTTTHVDIMLADKESNEDVRNKIITEFFTSLSVDGLSKGNVKKLTNAGHDSVCKILDMSEEDFKAVDGFQSRMAKKLHTGIKEKVEGASLVDIIAASGKLGRGLGKRKVGPVMEALPDILTSDATMQEKEDALRSVPGIGPENAKAFAANIPDLLDFLRECNLSSKLETKAPEPVADGAVEEASETTEDHPLKGKKVVMSKTRDKEVIAALEKYGASISGAVSKNVSLVIVKDADDSSSKIQKARDFNIPVMDLEEFKKTYM